MDILHTYIYITYIYDTYAFNMGPAQDPLPDVRQLGPAAGGAGGRRGPAEPPAEHGPGWEELPKKGEAFRPGVFEDFPYTAFVYVYVYMYISVICKYVFVMHIYIYIYMYIYIHL